MTDEFRAPPSPGDVTGPASAVVHPNAEYTVSVLLDGDQWCAIMGDDLAVDPVGFGPTRGEALAELALRVAAIDNTPLGHHPACAPSHFRIFLENPEVSTPDALPPDESPQRNAVCDAPTDALVWVGVAADEANESPTLDLRDTREVRGLARILTMRDGEGRDGELGENSRTLWNRIRAALIPHVSRPDLTGETPPEPQSVVPVYHLRQIAADIASVAHYLIDGETKRGAAIELVGIAHRLNALDVKPWTDAELAKLTRKAGRLVNADV